jgi:hypothetical protein
MLLDPFSGGAHGLHAWRGKKILYDKWLQQRKLSELIARA